MRLEDHLFLVTGDLNAFPMTTRQHLSRYMTDLEPSVLEHWNLEPDLILDHPLCAPPSEEERQWIEQQLQLAISPSDSGGMPPQSTVFGTMEGGLESPDPEDMQAATESLNTVAREWATPEAQPLKENVVYLEPDSTETLSQSNQVESLPDAMINLNLKHSNESQKPVVEPTSNNLEEVHVKSTHARLKERRTTLNEPRKAQRIRRRSKTTAVRTAPRNQQGIQAAAANAHDAKELIEIRSSSRTPQNSFSNSLADYDERQKKAVESMRLKSSAKSDSSLNDATRQKINRQELNLPETPLPIRPLEAINGRQPINTHTKLTPLLARPGVTSPSQPQDVIRESASRQQTESPIEMKLSVWEVEDRERLRKELEGAKK